MRKIKHYTILTLMTITDFIFTGFLYTMGGLLAIWTFVSFFK